MTTPRKPTASEVWDAIEETSFRAEVDRIVGMSVEEVEAELLKEGFRPEDLAQPILTERANAQAERGGPANTESTQTREQLIRGWLFAERLIEEEADRIAAMSDEEFERLAATMPAPTKIPTEQELDERSARRRAAKRR